MDLEKWIRNKLSENEKMHDYAVSTESVRCWIDEHNKLYPNVGNKVDIDAFRERSQEILSSIGENELQDWLDNYKKNTKKS